TNSAEQLYVALSDGTNTSVVEHNDVNAATLTTWQEWNIKLSDFTTVNLDAIKKVYIGLGDRDVPVQGGSGAIYVDDIRACPPRCIPALAKPLYDFAGPGGVGAYDCIVNELDLALVGAGWLTRDEYITSVNPGDANLVAHYEFEGNAIDSSINALHVIGQAIVLDGVDDYVDCNNDNSLFDITGYVTVAAWVKLNQGGLDQKIAANQDGISGGYKMGVFSDDRAEFEIRTSANTAILNRNVAGGTVLQTDVWYHVAGVYSEGNYIRTYVDGKLDRELVTTEILGTSTKALVLGRQPLGDNYFNGQMDDVRIYSVALSKGEIAYLATDGGAGIHIPIQSDADVYQGEAPGNQWINFKDYALIADKYLEEMLWPTP
ncbi:MAG: LamG domain-containing protein, partial [Planctomycetota bacterium]